MQGHDHFLKEFVRDFAEGIRRADARMPIATSARSEKTYQSGIGPHTETRTVELVVVELKAMNPAKYGTITTNVPYPSISRQRCDLVLDDTADHWFIEVKMMRLMGDNGKANDNILTHILSPYPQHRSALTDCAKLTVSGFNGRYAILIYGYDYDGWPLDPVISSAFNGCF